MAEGPSDRRTADLAWLTDQELLRRYHEGGDVEARQLLIERNLNLVRRLAQRYAHRGEAIEDLMQVGCVGLIKAVDRYDGRRNVALSTYAGPNVLGEIKRHFRDKGWAIRVPRDVQELNVSIARVSDALTARLGRTPTIRELADATRTTPEHVAEALESSRAYNAISLWERSDEEDGPELLDGLGEDESGYRRSEQRFMLREGLGRLPAREGAILHMRFFEGLTQSEIAERVGVSQMHVSRLIRQSIDTMRGALNDEPAQDRAASAAG